MRIHRAPSQLQMPDRRTLSDHLPGELPMAVPLDRPFARTLLVLAAVLAPGIAWGQGGALRVGAARVNITPPGVAAATVRDSLYVRAIVIDNGVTRAALISADQAGSDEATWATASREIGAALDAPPENVLISVTHTHS